MARCRRMMVSASMAGWQARWQGSMAGSMTPRWRLDGSMPGLSVHDDGDGRHHQGGPFDVKIVVPSGPHLRRHVSSSVGAILQAGLRRRASQTQQGNIFEPLLQHSPSVVRGKDTTPGAGPSTDKLRSRFDDFEWFFEACSADRLFLGKSRKFIENRPFHT